MVCARLPRPSPALLLLCHLTLAPAASGDLQVAPVAVDFGQVPLEREASRSVRLHNSGFEPVLVSAVYVTGNGFDLPAPPVTGVAVTLDPGDSLCADVRYRPAVARRATARLTAVAGLDTLLVALRAQGTRVLVAEVLADPPSGLAGDANGDGTRHSYEDEFVELWNAGADTVALAGWGLGDDDAPLASWFRFPSGWALPPQGRVVVFGGGDTAALPAPALVDDGRIGDGLANGGDTVVLVDADGDTADWVVGRDWGDDQSLGRDAADGELMPHTAPPGRGTPFSPGRPRVVLDSVRVHPPAVDLVEGAAAQLLALGHWSDGHLDTAGAAGLNVVWTCTDASRAHVGDGGDLLALHPGETLVRASWRDAVEGFARVRVEALSLEPQRCRVVIDEVLADPPSGQSGDANGDGQRHSYEDEFVELYNAGPDTARLDGWSVLDDDVTPDRGFRFAAGTVLPPGERLTLFGGGLPSPALGRTAVDDGRLGNGLTNGGDRVFLVDAAGDTVDAVCATSWPADQSLVRWPPLAVAPPGGELPARPDPAAFVPHGDPPGTGEPCSPGRERYLEPPPSNRAPQLTLPDSIPLFGGRPLGVTLAPTDPDGDDVHLSLLESPDWVRLAGGALAGVAPAVDALTRARVQAVVSDGASANSATTWLVCLPWPRLALTEVLADPPPGPAGDANGDGKRHSYEDEFVELLNQGPDLDLGGWSVADAGTAPARRFRFPAGTTLARGERLVLFGGGVPAGLAGQVYADDGRLGSGLGNRADRLLVVAANPADTVLDVAYETSVSDQSLHFGPPGSAGAPADLARAVAHGDLPGWLPFSPGLPRPVLSEFRADTVDLTVGEAAPLQLWGVAPDTLVAIASERALWLPRDTGVAEVYDRRQVTALRPGRTVLEAWIDSRLAALTEVRVRPRPPPPNEPPRFAAAPDTQCLANGHYRFAATATDPEGATLSYCPVRVPPWLHLDRATGLLSGRVPDAAGQTWEVALQAADGRSGLAVLRFALHCRPRPQVRIAEVLADPPSGRAGDANGDGARHSYHDEFVELVNTGPRALDLAGWELRDGNARGSGAFRFPPGTVLAPGARLAVFGGGRPAAGGLAATGRLGDGLGNRRDVVYLIAPDGPDTLAHAAWDLARDPDQALCWNSGPEPELHGEWPHRGACSPGLPRPRLVSLHVEPARVSVPVGRDATVQVFGRCSDGQVLPLHRARPRDWPEPAWASSAPHVATADPDGALRTQSAGTARLSVRLDTFAASVPVEARTPLATRLVFAPTWSSRSVPRERPLQFAAERDGSGHANCRWWVNGALEATGVERFTWARPAGPRRADTVRVVVEERRPASHRPESAARTWVLRDNAPPVLHPLADTTARPGQPFRARLSAADDDGDRLVYQLLRGPVGMTLSPFKGAVSWMPAASDAGRVSFCVRVLDGLGSVERTFYLRVVVAAARPAASALLSAYPNPFRQWRDLQWEIRPPCADPELRVYNALGQPLARLRLDGGASPGDPAGAQVCPALAARLEGVTGSGVYVAALFCSRQSGARSAAQREAACGGTACDGPVSSRPVATARLLLLR